MLWIYLIIGVIADTANIYIAKRLIDSGNLYWLTGVALTALVLNFTFIMALREGYLSIVTATWLIAVLIGGVVMGYFLFNDQISNTQWVGLSLAVISIILLQWPSHKFTLPPSL